MCYIHVPVWMCTHVCAAVHASVFMHVGALFFWDRVTHWIWRSIIHLGWLTSGPTWLYLPGTEWQTCRVTLSFSHEYWGAKFRSLCSRDKHFYQLSHLLRPIPGSLFSRHMTIEAPDFSLVYLHSTVCIRHQPGSMLQLESCTTLVLLGAWPHECTWPVLQWRRKFNNWIATTGQ